MWTLRSNSGRSLSFRRASGATSLVGLVAVAVVVPSFFVAACGGTTDDTVADASVDAANDSSTGNVDAATDSPTGDTSTTDSSVSDASDASVRVPAQHRPTATDCTGVRSTIDPTVPDASGAPASCHTHAECTAGRNGRCTGNGHDGWRCTYDECVNDTECTGGKVCGCDKGFRAGTDVCLTANCRVDGDCGANGYCSPSFGSCGDYSGVIAYYCHVAADECLDDTDCGPQTVGQRGYCAFESSVGHWKCSYSHCAG